jgi:hypothetical protein
MAVEIEERRKILGNRYNRNNPGHNQQPYILTLNFPSSPSYSTTGISSYFKDFKAVCFRGYTSFPLRLKPLAAALDEDKKLPTTPGINNRLIELVKLMHGSFESK